MNICIVWKLIFLAMLTAMLTIVPRAIADDIAPDPDAAAASSVVDSSPPNQVLEIPQQCDQASVAVLCDRSSDDSSMSSDATDASADTPDATANGAGDLANNPDLGSVYDYANQNITNDASAAGTMNVPVGTYVPSYPLLSPSPTVISSRPVGPGSYQQWAAGPGSYQQFAPGPGYIQPAPLGYRPYGLGGSFGARPFTGIGGGGHFGRR